MLKYCQRCVLPDSKPDLVLDDEGVCNACRSFEARKEVDWAERWGELENLVERYRRPGSPWDCLIPVSGGKDSTFQVVKMLQLGARPLCVVSTTCDLTEVGRKNIENLKRLGVDTIEVSPDPLVRARLNRVGLVEVGDISWPEHVGIFTIPVRVAVQHRIPLIVWGENSQNEYGGPAAAAANNVLNRRWLEEFGGLLGLRVSDLVSAYGFSDRDLALYTYPSDAELAEVGVTGLFLGHYLPWDGLANSLVAHAHGFTSFGSIVEGSMVDYENLDNYQTGVHDYFKFLKFAFGRASDHASLHVRRGRLTRRDAVDIVKRLDGAFPSTYMGKGLADVLAPLDLDLADFEDICDRFTNRSIFRVDSDGRLIKNKSGQPIRLVDVT